MLTLKALKVVLKTLTLYLTQTPTVRSRIEKLKIIYFKNKTEEVFASLHYTVSCNEM
jgi:hypothetical protein